ncbi:hypothetical protein M885DRAFT_498626 [Pelagophyceae sp. CCMP2097]|nr:hypothetical protein M885DRAFT_498626 [Pelagophyceae sp. CCMP2097]
MRGARRLAAVLLAAWGASAGTAAGAAAGSAASVGASSGVAAGVLAEECGLATPAHASVLTTARGKAAFQPGKKAHFVVLMMGPRVGSKMVQSQLSSHGGVFMKGERTEANLLEASKGASLPQLLRDFFESPRNASIRAVGFKTEKYLKWSREAYVKGDLYKEAPTSLFGDLGARIICLPRLNVLARAVSGQTKVGGVAQGNVTVDVECGAKRFKREFQKIDRFFDECARLGDSTHALWLPYETVKDGAPGQQDALNVVQRFLKLVGSSVPTRFPSGTQDASGVAWRRATRHPSTRS